MKETPSHSSKKFGLGKSIKGGESESERNKVLVGYIFPVISPRNGIEIQDSRTISFSFPHFHEIRQMLAERVEK